MTSTAPLASYSVLRHRLVDADAAIEAMRGGLFRGAPIRRDIPKGRVAAWTRSPAHGQEKQRSARDQNESTQKNHQPVAFREVLARQSDGNQDARYWVVGSKRPSLQVFANRHGSLPRGVHRFAEAQAAVSTALRLWRVVSKRRDGAEPDEASASRAADSTDVRQIDNAAQERQAGADRVDRGPRAVLPAVTEHADRGEHERHDHDLYPVPASIDEFADGHRHGRRLYSAVGAAP
jgi:hypothetical protein